MDIARIQHELTACPCGRAHQTAIRAVEIGSGLTARAAAILTANAFPRSLLLVADNNTLRAAGTLPAVLRDGGFELKTKLYEDLRVADMEQVEELEALCGDVDGILSVGSGSLNDICRLAAYRRQKPLAIYATAPSMDGFASNSAPITKNNFKVSYPAVQPQVIIADTTVLAAAPAVLKSAGFGDMVAKYIALADWRIAALTVGEYYCDRIAALSANAVEKIVRLADKVTAADEEAAGAIMEALVLTGLCMGFADSVRPASGAEHVLSHFWEIKKLQQDELSDFHGRKVGVATVLINAVYRDLTLIEQVHPRTEEVDWDAVKVAYGPGLADDMMKANRPTVTAQIQPETLAAQWGTIRAIVRETLPAQDELLRLMRLAGAPTDIDQIGVSPALCTQGLEYHAFMRYRLTLMRLRPMIGI